MDCNFGGVEHTLTSAEKKILLFSQLNFLLSNPQRVGEGEVHRHPPSYFEKKRKPNHVWKELSEIQPATNIHVQDHLSFSKPLHTASLCVH